MSVFVRSLSSRCLLSLHGPAAHPYRHESPTLAPTDSKWVIRDFRRSVFTKSLPLASVLLTSNLWISGIAVARNKPRSFSVSQVDGMAFFSDTKRLEYVSRIAALSPQSSHCWGTMTVDQGLHHLNLACGSGLGFYQLPDEKLLLITHAISVGFWSIAFPNNRVV